MKKKDDNIEKEDNFIENYNYYNSNNNNNKFLGENLTKNSKNYKNPCLFSFNYLNIFEKVFNTTPKEIKDIVNDFSIFSMKKTNKDFVSLGNYFSRDNFFISEAFNLVEDSYCDIPSELICINKNKSQEKFILLQIILFFISQSKNYNCNSNKNKTQDDNEPKRQILNGLGLDFSSNATLSEEKILNLVLLIYLFMKSFIFFKSVFGFLPLDGWVD